MLREEGCEVMGFFYRHNIHPFTECMKREDGMKQYADNENLHVIYQKGYELEEFLRNTAFRENNRCVYCYHDRLLSTALMAKRGKFSHFSSTLLYSRHQNHDMLISVGESISKKTGVSFLYRDFRSGWEYGIETSKQMGLYRQQYCGCIYSEKDRFFKKGR